MPKQVAKAEINAFHKGFITEASPLNFPPDATIDEQNFELNISGKRNRRLGIDFESEHILIDTQYSASSLENTEVNTFLWIGAGGVAANEFAIMQFGNRIDIFDSSKYSMSSDGFINSVTLTSFPTNIKYSFTAVDGMLVIAAGKEEIYVVEYVDGVFSSTTYKLMVRDMWGVYSGSQQNKHFRPKYPTEYHVYNLRNQGWAFPRRCKAPPGVTYTLTNKTAAESGEILEVDVSKLGKKFTFTANSGTASDAIRDPIESFRWYKGVFPAMSESVWTAVSYAAGSPPYEFMWANLFDEVFGSNPDAAKGFFIINALRRGEGRKSALQAHHTRFPEIIWKVENLPEDRSDGGATVVAEFAGRVFYAGFDGGITGGDANSPSLSNYIFFSQNVKNKSDLQKCYQEGDPTSREASDVVDTDGGFIKISGASNIIKMVAIGKVLAVIANNGVWLVKGGSDYGFTASNYMVEKITSAGSKSPFSTIYANNSLFYWADDGIYTVSQNQFGDYIAQSITEKTIQSFYDEIDTVKRKSVSGVYDVFNKKLKWIIGCSPNMGNTDDITELSLDLQLGAWSKFVFKASPLNKIAGFIPPSSYKSNLVTGNILCDGVAVTSSGTPVEYSYYVELAKVAEIKYLVLSGEV